MKSLTILSFATSILGAAVLKKQALPTEYEIRDFTAECTPHSTFCNYNFSVISDPAGPPSHCSASMQGFGQLPEVLDGQCTDNTAFIWTIVKAPNGDLDLSIGYRWPLNVCAGAKYCHVIPAGLIANENNGAGTSQRYTGPGGFDASVFEC